MLATLIQLGAIAAGVGLAAYGAVQMDTPGPVPLSLRSLDPWDLVGPVALVGAAVVSTVPVWGAAVAPVLVLVGLAGVVHSVLSRMPKRRRPSARAGRGAPPRAGASPHFGPLPPR